MARVWDYFGFAICFAGLGYAGLCLAGSHELLALPPSLRAFGLGAAVFVPVRAVMEVCKRRRAAAAPRPTESTPEVVARPARRKATYPIRKVKPRNHFGLRGAPR
mgnify:FL=1